MNSEENAQSANNDLNLGTEDDLKSDQDDDGQCSTLSPSGQLLTGGRRSRFFRSKRKQRLPQDNVEGLNISNTEGSSESSVYSSESPG